MKTVAVLFLMLLLFAGSVFGQTAFVPVGIAIPQIAVGGDADGENYITLLQVVNNNSAVITGHVVLYSDNGSVLPVLFDGQGPQPTFDFTLAVGEARQIQLTLNGALTAGWMEITYSPNDALTTVILQFRSGATVLSEVGVDPSFAGIAATDLPAETSATLNTGIAIANPSASPAYVLVGLWDPSNGNFLTGVAMTLPPNGHIARFLTELFPGVSNIAQIRAKVSLDACSSAACTAPGGELVATALRQSGDQFTIVPVSERQSVGEKVRILPQVAFGGPADGLNMKTVLYFTTSVPSGVFGTAEIFDNDGNPILASADGGPPSSSITVTVLGNRVSRIVLSGDQTLRSGWIRLTLSSTVNLIGNAVFQTYGGSTLLSEASVLESEPSKKGLIYVKSQAGRSDVGVALANPQPTENTITLELFDHDGFVAGVRDITLSANGHLAQFITELFPQISAQADFDGALSIHSATPFSALALRVSGDKVATLPVAVDGMFRPYINALRVTSTQRSPGRVNFTIDVTDVDADLVSSSSTTISGFAYIDFGAAGYDQGPVSIDGAVVVNRATGTISGSFQPPNTGTIPAGYHAGFYITISDSAGNESNFVAVPVTF